MINECLNCQTQTANPKFCSRSCSATFTNKGKIKTLQTKQKISEKLSVFAQTPKAKEQYIRSGKKGVGRTWAKPADDSWLAYKKAAVFYTPYRIIHMIQGFELIKELGWYHPVKNPEGASRDHMYSAYNGWRNKVPLNIIRHPANCRIIPMQENRSKGKKNIITLEELYSLIDKWNSRSDLNRHKSDYAPIA